MRHLYLVIFLFILPSLIACSDNNEENDNENSTKIVKLYEVQISEPRITRQFVGEVAPLNTVDMSFQVPGRLTEFPVQQGETKQQGQRIAALDPTDYELAVQSAQANKIQAEADLRRKRNLFEQGAVSGIERDVAEANYVNAKTQLEQARQELSYTVLHAPFDALITRRLIDTYSLVSPEAPVLRIQDVSELRVRTHIPESFFERILADETFNYDDAEIYAILLSNPLEQHQLSYREHVTEADPATQTYEVEFALEHSDRILALPGMVASVHINLPQTKSTAEQTRLPVNALSTNEQGDFYVWVFDNNEIRKVDVNVVQIDMNNAYVEADLKDGDQVVAAGAYRLRSGDSVKPMGDQF